ncbi:hypothetical protein P378_11720 [Desulforamulus profundi]|uniref:Uncharacterized protein n=1 Tax=Desulforamulus profundi TaxID=1383067 RepID=A0A2C6L2G2_9FIRM|nr:hypothetical protein P378_11720 [Desulforamulus profundi]
MSLAQNHVIEFKEVLAFGKYIQKDLYTHYFAKLTYPIIL